MEEKQHKADRFDFNSLSSKVVAGLIVALITALISSLSSLVTHYFLHHSVPKGKLTNCIIDTKKRKLQVAFSIKNLIHHYVKDEYSFRVFIEDAQKDVFLGEKPEEGLNDEFVLETSLSQNQINRYKGAVALLIAVDKGHEDMVESIGNYQGKLCVSVKDTTVCEEEKFSFKGLLKKDIILDREPIVFLE